MGAFNSTAFHVKDPAAFNQDPLVKKFQEVAHVLEGQMPDDPAPCFSLARDMEPRESLFIAHQATTAVISEARDEDPEVDDSEGWITLLQKHLRPEDGIIVTEYGNLAAPEDCLTWAITVDAARCYV